VEEVGVAVEVLLIDLKKVEVLLIEWKKKL
jgi:hypothetical protein